MKIRNGFVSNSSSCSFSITSYKNHDVSLKEFIEENYYLVDEHYRIYSWLKNKPSKKEVLEDAEKRGDVIRPGENTLIYGDEDGDIIGAILDYALRDTSSRNEDYVWELLEMLR